MYVGYAEASKVSPDWHGWLHYMFDQPPTTEPLPRRRWEKPHLPNLSGTPFAYRPRGSLARGGERASATGDYEAWRRPRASHARAPSPARGVLTAAALSAGLVSRRR